jgi:hypothetical protein
LSGACSSLPARRHAPTPNDCDASPSNSHSAFSFATAIGLIAAIPATIFYNKFDYGTMMRVMGRLSAAGYYRVALVTEVEQGGG